MYVYTKFLRRSISPQILQIVNFFSFFFGSIFRPCLLPPGAVFLHLCKELKMENHPLINSPVDPSLFIHRFADKLNFPSKPITQKVSATALRLVSNMKRDWIQTGRRPASVCGAALFVAAQIHGVPRTKAGEMLLVFFWGGGNFVFLRKKS